MILEHQRNAPLAFQQSLQQPCLSCKLQTVDVDNIRPSRRNVFIHPSRPIEEASVTPSRVANEVVADSIAVHLGV